MARSLVKDTYYLSQIRKELDNGDNAFEIVFNISRIIKKWEDTD